MIAFLTQRSLQVLLLLSLTLVFSCRSTDWRNASKESVGIAPPAASLTEDIFQIYFARAFSWKGYFAVHPWVAWKEVSEEEYNIAQVFAWNLKRGESAVGVHQGLPDRRWVGSIPHLLVTLKGEKATVVIAQLKELLKTYPYGDTYHVWPGPNSNTFVNHIIRNIPELKIELPPTAVGKDYLTNGSIVDWSPSGTGVQLSLFGALGVTLGFAEGVEVNILGFNFGVDVMRPALKLPLIGRLGFSDKNL